MSNIYDIPFDDIKNLLLENNIEITNDKLEMYDMALTLMNDLTTSYKNVSNLIIEWMLAHNVLKKNIILLNYDILTIKNMNQIELNKLAKKLGMKSNNINSIIHILQYLHKLRGYNKIILNSNFDEIILLLQDNLLLYDEIYKLLPRVINNMSYDDDFENKLYQFANKLIIMKKIELTKYVIRLAHNINPKIDYISFLRTHTFDNEL